ncbi:Transcription factor bHLH47 [Raphanus sativus]|uniref:Transcription factor bHLH47 n=1 Tax=Raphanus sativus TaxID=3726 RepID=A0A6J0NLB5_RAPSA|nr:transcription factor bHLH47 [Raphanus sativus]XP_018485547.1 transcription factor bHLH47 [Raphanus sativus]KAJ4895634.1 Transcription factor bHLH47 [Raphanus sativus]
MGSKTPSTSTHEANAPPVDERSRKGKVPKRINKAVRERLKREQLNDLFIELADSLELNQQNSGKASVLCEATRFLKDVFGQIESLRKEHTSLLSESNYVTTEKNELKEETSVLETEISRLQSEIEARVNQSKPDLNTSPAPEYNHHHHHHHHYQQRAELASQFSGLPIFQGAGFQQSSAAAPPHPGPTVLVLPMQPDVQTQAPLMYNNSSNVSKPCPRYASAADSWPSRLLGERLKANE